MARPVATVEIAFATDPLSAAPTFVDVTAYAKELSFGRGKQFELDRVEAGEAQLLLEDTDRRFDPTNVAGAYYPNVKPVRRTRIRATHNAITYDLWHGFVDSWPPVWEGPGDPQLTPVNVRGTDAFKMFASIDLPDTVWELVVRDLAPDHWWRFGERIGVGVADSGTDPKHGRYYGSPTLGEASLIGQFDDDHAISFDGYNDYVGVLADLFIGPFTIAFWIQRPEALADEYVWLGASPSGEYGSIAVKWSANQGTIKCELNRGAGTVVQEWRSSVRIDDDAPHFVVFTRTGTTLACYVDGIVDTVVSRNDSAVDFTPNQSHVLMTDRLVSTPANYTAGVLDEWMYWGSALAAADVTALSAAALTPWRGEKAGARIAKLLDLDVVGWPAGDRALDVGISDLQELALEGKLLEQLQAAADADQGQVLMGPEGDVVFQDRHYRSTASLEPVALFGDGERSVLAISADFAAPFVVSHAGLQIPGDLDVRVGLALDDWTPGAYVNYAERWVTAGNNLVWWFGQQTAGNFPVFFWSPTGVAVNFAAATAAPVVADGAPLLMRVTLDVDNGAAGRTVTFYTKPLDPSRLVMEQLKEHTGWTVLGTPVVTAGVTSIYAAGVVSLALGYDGNSGAGIRGRIYGAVLYNGIAGTVVADPDFSEQSPATPSIGVQTLFTDAAGNTWLCYTVAAGTLRIVPDTYRAAEIEYAELEMSFDDARIANRVEVTRRGGGSATAEDAASRATYGTRTLERTLDILDDDEATDAANFLLSQYATPRVRFDRMVLRPGDDDDAAWAALLPLELGDRVTVRRRPPGGGAVIERDVYVEHISHRLRDIDEWEVELALSPAEGYDFWILGDAEWGVLGTTTRLGY